jgi:lysophospholipase L1-like esterase
LELNRLIVNNSKGRGVLCVDLFTATGDSARRLRHEFSNDGLHLSTSGYEAMAEAIFSGAVKEIVSRYLGDARARLR